MSKTHDDGGPVCPIPEIVVGLYENGQPSRMELAMHSYGMSLWDYYAGQALEGLLSNSLHDVLACNAPVFVVKRACDMADAMIKERKARREAQ